MVSLIRGENDFFVKTPYTFANMERLKVFIERWYRPLFLTFLAAIVGISFELGRTTTTTASAHGVVFSCDKNVLDTLSMQPLLNMTAVADSIPKKEIIATVADSSGAHNFLASKNGTKYYPVGCGAASRIKEENKVWFDTEQDAQLQGYTRTTAC